MSTIAEDYLSGRDGSVTEYHMGLARGERIGQAFFNALNPKDRERLRGSLFDPFFKNSSYGVRSAIDFLLDTEHLA